ncbi:class I SAM-dependent methyltransferase [Streptomyces lunaelactis]|uniref:class I SAM-dependent methyltransferase n=1 Tax=Streptomyces lunaelactis TaxID=1535768 RepID=UPI002815633B|nr:class I SAM-dependent methyltransferase [Streptomyces lunaelactis]
MNTPAGRTRRLNERSLPDVAQRAVTYWEPLWRDGRHYRPLIPQEEQLLARYLGPGPGRPALDIGCGAGELARHLHERLDYRVTAIDCAPSALATATSTAPNAGEITFQLMDFMIDDLSHLPDPAYAVITCRLVYRWVEDKAGLLQRVRSLLVPGGTFWVVTELAETTAGSEQLTAGWSSCRTVDLDRLCCYALRP